MKKSRKLETVESRMEPETRMVLARSRCSAASSVSRSISADARHPLRGVRTYGVRACGRWGAGRGGGWGKALGRWGGGGGVHEG